MGPALCLEAIPSSMARVVSGSLQVEMCRGENSSAIVSCVGAFGGGSGNKALLSSLPPATKISICKGGEGNAPAECMLAMPPSLELNHKISLCTSAKSTAPALCTTALGGLSGSKRTSSDSANNIAASVCSGAISAGPALCFLRSSKGVTFQKLDVESRAALCHMAGVEEPEAPVDCFVATVVGGGKGGRLTQVDAISLCSGGGNVKGRTACARAAPLAMTSADRLYLCSGEPSSDNEDNRGDGGGAAACYSSAPATLDDSLRVRLCRRASASSPDAAVRCVRAAPSHLSWESRVALCEKGVGEGPGRCAKVAIAPGVAAPTDILPILCGDAEDEKPAVCYRAAPPSLTPHMRARLCSGAVDESPATCALAAYPLYGSADTADGAGTGQCAMKGGGSGPPRRVLEKESVVEVCRQGGGVEGVRCLQMAPHAFKGEHWIALCADGGKAAVACAESVPLFALANHEVADLCRGADTTGPARCVTQVSSVHASSIRVAVCKGAKNDTPAYCINSVPAATEEAIKMCRDVVPVVSSLSITELSFHGEHLYSGTNIRAVLAASDQWNRPMTWDSVTAVTARVAKKGSNGAIAIGFEGGRPVEVLEGGIATYRELSFTAPGNLTVIFEVNGVTMASARVNVEETEHERLLRKCGDIFGSFQCLTQEWRHADADGGWGSSTQTVSQLRWPSGLMAVQCSDILKEGGFRVVYGWKSAVWLWYHPAVEILESGRGLPTKEMSWRERLGVTEDATMRQIKKAYYAGSLRWHPDRWSTYKMHIHRAKELFLLVSEAYQALVEEANEADPRDAGTEPTIIVPQ